MQSARSDEAFQILDLSCNSDESVAATAIMSKEYQFFHSVDRGLTWSIAGRAYDKTQLGPRFFTDPRDGSGGSLIVFAPDFGRRTAWMKSMDFGRTWETADARLLPEASWHGVLVVVDETGRLATLGRSNTLLMSDDNGATWGETKLPIRSGAGMSLGLDQLSSNGRGRLVVVGRVSSPFKRVGTIRAVVVASDDSGKHGPSPWTTSSSVRTPYSAAEAVG